ncbi:MAG: helix-turn-helix transcriptional regulator [Nitrospirota bacterium]
MKIYFGKALKKLREDRGISQEELAYESGYHRTYISQLERGQKSPSMQTIFQLASALNVKPSEIVHAVEDLLSKKH